MDFKINPIYEDYITYRNSNDKKGEIDYLLLQQRRGGSILNVEI